MEEPIIQIKGISKKYIIRHETAPYKTFQEAITNAIKAPINLIKNNGGLPKKETFWALKDITFDVNKGEAIGIIGRNGAGKSTLLKVLSRITEPTEGQITLRGRVASLLEVGTGFHPELTGRENIYLNGSVLGMTKKEIDSKFDEIVEFSGVEKFLDTPVKRYSSGMYVRLAFAVAAHLEPEILIVDEVLSVGDAEFQKKCMGKMGEVAEGGRTVLFVSHNMSAIKGLCTRVIHLDAGTVISQGSAADQIELYLSRHQKNKNIDPNAPINIGSNLQLRRFEFYPNPVESCGKVDFLIELWAPHPARIEAVAILLFSSLNSRVAIIDLRHSDNYTLNGSNSIVIQGNIKSLPLVEGEYNAGLYFKYDGIGENFLDVLHLDISVKSGQQDIIPYPPAARGLVELDTSFTVQYNNSQYIHSVKGE